MSLNGRALHCLRSFELEIIERALIHVLTYFGSKLWAWCELLVHPCDIPYVQFLEMCFEYHLLSSSTIELICVSCCPIVNSLPLYG